MHQTAYINTDKVFNEFIMKKQLEIDYKKVGETRKLTLDSLMLQLNMLENMLTQSSNPDKQKLQLYRIKQKEYEEKRESIERANESLLNKYNEQIWTQINQYVKDYGIKKNYDYIYGANGDGAIMYANEALNITNEITKYINDRYEGKQ
jgi:outer membrane protein